MKIIQITPSYKPAFIYGGPTISVSSLCEAIQQEIEFQSPIQLEVLTTLANGKEELNFSTQNVQKIDGVNVNFYKRITKDHTHFSPALFLALWKKINQEKKTNNQHNLIIHIHSWWNLVAIFGALVAKITGTKYIISPRGMLNDYTSNNRNSFQKKLIHATLGKYLLKNAHILITSKKEQIEFKKVCQPLSVAELPNIIYLPEKLPIRSITSSDEINLIFLSRINEVKGIELFFQALSQVDFSWKLNIAGTGEFLYIDKLMRLADHLEISHAINWLGHIENKDKFELLVQSDLLCLTSYTENFANVVIESLAVGTPVLLSDQVGLADYVIQNQLGFITALNIEAIVSTLNLAYQSKTQRLNIQNKAPKLIQADFQANQLAKKYVSYYQNILETKYE